MATVPAALILAFAAAKCPPPLNPHLVAATAQVESGDDALAIHDNTTGARLHPANEIEAVQIARDLLSQGHSLDLGLMQINFSLERYGPTREGLDLMHAFEPIPSVETGCRIMRQNMELASRYNSGSPDAGIRNGYATKILQAMAAVQAMPTPAQTAAPPPDPDPVKPVVRVSAPAFPAQHGGGFFAPHAPARAFINRSNP